MSSRTEAQKFQAACKRVETLTRKVARNEADPEAAYRAADRACYLSRFVIPEASSTGPFLHCMLAAEITHARTEALRAAIRPAIEAGQALVRAEREAEMKRLDEVIREKRIALRESGLYGYTHELATKGTG